MSSNPNVPMCINQLTYEKKGRRVLDHSTSHSSSDWILPLFEKILDEFLPMSHIGSKNNCRSITDQGNASRERINQYGVSPSNFDINFQSNICKVLLAHFEDMLS